MKVLIVEDEWKIRTGMAKLIVSHTEHEVVGEAKNGKEALDLVMRFHPHLIISDIRMPVMDGLEATREIRSIDREDASLVPIIAMTANAFLEDVEKSKEAGMNEYVTKPIDMRNLIRIIEENVRKEK